MSTELPSSWTTVRLEELLAPLDDGRTLHHGWSPQCEKEPARSDTEWGVLKTTAIQAGSFLPEHNKRLPSSLAPRPQHEVKAGDLLITCAGPRVRCGVPCLVRITRPRLMLSGKMYRFRTSPDLCEPGYLEKYLLSHAAQQAIDAMKTGGSDSGLNLTHDRFKPLPVPLAPVREQQRIVSRIEELFSEIDEGERALERVGQLVERYRQSVLKAAVTGELTREWRKRRNTTDADTGETLLRRILDGRRSVWEESERARLAARGDVSRGDAWKARYRQPMPPITEGLPYLPKGWVWASPNQLEAWTPNALTIGPFGSDLKVSDYRSEGVRLVFVRNIRSRDFGGPAAKYVDPAKAADLSSHTARSGDLLITKMGDPPGDACVYPAGLPDAVITADCIKWSLAPPLPSPAFFEAFINSTIGRSQFKSITKGVAQQKVTLDAFRQLAIALPGADEQLEIERRLSLELRRLSEIGESLSKERRRGGALRQSILKAAFSGQLVPQDPRDEPASALLARLAAQADAAPAAAHRRGRSAGRRPSQPNPEPVD